VNRDLDALPDELDATEDARLSPDDRPSLHDVIALRLSRRGLLLGAGAAAVSAAGAGLFPRRAEAGGSSLTFKSANRTITDQGSAAPGYRADPVIRWGDPLTADAAPFDPKTLTGAEQTRRFGYNCDFIAFVPRGPDEGLLAVNHEYTNGWLMRPGVADWKANFLNTDKAWAAVEMAAHGHSVVHVRRSGGRWAPAAGSALNRRLTASTPMRLSGPAAGHDRLRTKADPSGRAVLGTLNNCAGGVTPWGTVLIAEENFHYYFAGTVADVTEAANFKRLGLRSVGAYAWFQFDRRFDMTQEPHEPNRFGYIVEFDPRDPASVPVKRTALGRFKHEGAGVTVGRNNRVAVYSGDDQRGEYVYKFVARRPYDAANPGANRDLLDDGVLYAAKFEADGGLLWLPLVHGEGPLTRKNGFESQADVLIEARRAADLMGATPMDRPEDVEVDPNTGRVYVALTNNSGRGTKWPVDAANPRGPNYFGHILEIVPPGGTGAEADHAAPTATWRVFLLAGDPTKPAHGAKYHAGAGAENWFAAPDNLAFDPAGRLWIATDTGRAQERLGLPDGLYGTDVAGPGRALPKFLYAAPRGAELCGPAFTPDGRTVFAAVQHPGETKGSRFDSPSTRWPDFKSGMPPRPSVVAISKEDGGVIGG
jgi:secreted PhoX family phosphatase